MYVSNVGNRLREMDISIAEKWEKLSKIDFNFDDYNKLLNFLYLLDDKILGNKKLLPSINGDFHTLDNLFYDKNTNNAIKKAAIYYIERDLNNIY